MQDREVWENDMALMRKLKDNRKINPKEILSKDKLSGFELDLIMIGE